MNSDVFVLCTLSVDFAGLKIRLDKLVSINFAIAEVVMSSAFFLCSDVK